MDDTGATVRCARSGETHPPEDLFEVETSMGVQLVHKRYRASLLALMYQWVEAERNDHVLIFSTPLQGTLRGGGGTRHGG